jgi:hypothetical protein
MEIKVRNVSLLLRAEKTQPSCTGSRDLNWAGKGLNAEHFGALGTEKG